MSAESYYTVFETAAGWIALLGSSAGLRRATLPQRSEALAYHLLGNSVEATVMEPRYFADLLDCYRAYFTGGNVDFTCQLDFNGATPFQQAVWRAARLIPRGQTRSYQWVADRAGRPGAARAAGQALAANPLPVIVPCHRVLASDGSLGGFSGGLKMKEFLLTLEAKASMVYPPRTVNSLPVF